MINVKPGERAMLVSIRPHHRGETHIVPVTVGKVSAAGYVTLEGSPQRYRPDGTSTKKDSGWGRGAILSPWIDAEWQDFQRRQARDAAAFKLYQLGEALTKMSREAQAASDLWDKIPYSLHRLIENDTADAIEGEAK